MVKLKHEVSLERKSASALFKKRKFRGNKLIKISAEKTSTTDIQSNSNANSSTAPQFTRSPVNNFISSSA